MADIFHATIDNKFEFDCETIEDSFEKSIARYEFPYRSGALLEDMGQKARVIKIRLYFLNENYENHKGLINYLDQTDHLYELSHPQYGLVKGQIESMVIRHDDRLQTAEIDLTFIETLRGIIDTVYFPPADAGTEEAFITGQEELTDELTNDIEDLLGIDGADLIAQDLNPTKSTLFEQFSSLSKDAANYVKKADRFVAGLNSTLKEVTSPANSLVSTITYATNLPGVVIGALAQTVERYALLGIAAMTAPDRFLYSFLTGVATLEDAFPDFSKHIRIAKAQRASVEIASIFRADQANNDKQRQAASVKTFSLLGKPQKRIEATETILTITEIENTLARVRAALQTAIDDARGMQSLKTMAAVLTDHVIEIKKTRPPLITVNIDNTLPLHLVCMKYGFSYNEADQLLAINRIRQPNFVSGEVQVYAG